PQRSAEVGARSRRNIFAVSARVIAWSPAKPYAQNRVSYRSFQSTRALPLRGAYGDQGRALRFLYSRFSCFVLAILLAVGLTFAAVEDLMAEERNRTDLDTHTIWIFLLFAVLAIALAIVLLFRAYQSAAVASFVAGIVALCVLLAFLPILGSVKKFGF